MTTEQLRNSILQEAISGRLVPQDPNDEPASVLLQHIREEKERLVKAGKLKKKDLVETPITEDEIPFELPKGWVWARLKTIVYNHGQKTPSNKFSYIDIGSIDNKRQLLNPKETIIEAKDAPSRARKIVVEGDIVYSTVRPYLHNMAIVDKTFAEEPIASTGFAVFSCHTGLLNKYLFAYLLSPCFDSYANDGDNAKGVAYPAINDDKLYKAIIPLPPLAEQKRIVAKLEALLPIVDQYGKAQEELNELNAALPARLRQSILQEAISGRLVPQDPNDEPASVLLARIREEKARLVKEGKLKKKDLVETPITDEEKPFEIPSSWEWVRLSTYVDVRDGTHDSPKYHPSGIPFVTSKNLKNGRIDFSTCTFISQSDHDKFSERSYVEDGDILFAMIGSIGNPVIVAKDREFSVKNVALFKRYSREYTNNKYLYYYLSYIQNELKQIAAGGVQSFVGLGTLRQYLIPLPPLSEQQRIVAKTEELFEQIDKISK